jgi:class 3 adenylate cyclase/tetratricopeptide (TPR) repeat protein
MAQPHDHHAGAGSASILDERLRRYLPPDLADETAADFGDPDALPSRMIQAFVHLAATRYTIATYLPRLLVHQLLHERLESPWLRWVEGSLLFADLSGSTALAERLGMLGREGIELVTDFLNHIFTTMIQVVRDYGGDLVSFGGDALLVFFGDDRHPRTATRAALALQEALHGYVRSVPGVAEFPMHLHIGVESGHVAFGSAGHPHARHYSALGVAVNGVAAAEGHAGPGEVVVGPRAWAALAGYAEGAEVVPGFVRIDAVRAPARPHQPLAEESVMTDAPEAAIPRLLDDLDRISPYVPPLLLGRILADPERPQVEADLRPVTALFAQVAGLETPAEMLPPAQAAQALQAYVGAMQEAIEQFGGVINKLDVAEEGIKLVAIFGAPAAYEDHAERAARAALEMRDRIDGVNRQIADLLRAEDRGSRIEDRKSSSILDPRSSILKQRIGLNLGAVFAGNVGSAVRKEYTVMGDAVNIAARVMSKAAWGEIWCSAAAAQAISARMHCEERGQIALKGKAASLTLFRLLGERDPGMALAASDEGPLIGRERELGWLRKQMLTALGGDGRAVRVVGEAGVGKTRLTAALLEEAVARGARVIPAACFSYTAGIPYAAWAEWLRALCGIAAGDADPVRERKLADRLADLGPGMDEWLPVLGDLARLDVPDNRLTRGLDPQMRQTRRFELLEQLLLRAAEAGPFVALFEDLNWADPISLDLWRRVTTALAGRPVLLLGVHRPTPALDAEEDGARVLALKELSDEESGDLIAALAGDAALPVQLLGQLIHRAAGNPLFLAELVRAVLHQNGSLDELPDSLSGLLLARIDRLEEASRGVLRVASVIGQRIPFGILHSIQHADQQALLRQLARLDAQEMTVLERASPEPVHAFRHALIQEVAYQSMLYARRRDLHGRIGEYLEQRHADDLDDYYGLLAHHYRLSDRRDKAITYLLKAGHAARDVYANEEAMQYYGWALDALAGDEADPRMWETRDALGDVYATIGRYDDALAQQAAILAASEITPDAALRAHRKRGSVLEKHGQYATALEELEQAMAIVRSVATGISPLSLPLISADIALVRKRRAEYDLAVAACEEGLRALRDDGRTRDDELIEARLHSELGGIYGMRGDYPRAQDHFERSLQARETADDLPGIIFSRNNLGYLWQLQSEYERAIEHYRIAEDLARKINLRYMLVFAALNTAYALISLGSYAEAEARCVEAHDLSQEMKDRHNIAQIHNTFGVIFYHQGEYERALEAYDEALQLHRSLGSAHQEGNTLANLAATLNALGRFTDATAAAEQALERAEALLGQRLKAEALNALAEAALGRGDAAAATTYAEEAAALSSEIGSKHDGGVARRLLGQAAAANGAPHAAAFEASIGLFEASKNRFELARTWAAYGAALADHGNKIAARAYLNQARDTFVTIGANGELQRLALIVERSV